MEDNALLLAQARRRNKSSDITGMLLYKGGHYMQVLEGDEKKVVEVFTDIEKDARHHSIDVLRSEYVQNRNFPDWTMGFTDVDALDATTVWGFTRFLEHDFKSAYFSEDSVEAHAMLMAFKGSAET